MSAGRGPALLGVGLLAACAGTGPARPLQAFLEERELPDDVPVVLVDLDDTVYHRATRRPLEGAAEALQALAADHLIVYLTARPTHAKVPGLTENRDDSLAFLRENGFPEGPLFTSSLWSLVVHGQGGGKDETFEDLRDYGVETIELAVGDRPHDLEVYLGNGDVRVERSVILLIEAPGEVDRDRGGLPAGIAARSLAGSGPAWPRILRAYRSGELDAGAWVVSQPQP